MTPVNRSCQRVTLPLRLSGSLCRGSGVSLIVGLLAYLYIVFTGAQAIQLMQVQGQAQINLNDLVFRNLFSQHSIRLADYPAHSDHAPLRGREETPDV